MTPEEESQLKTIEGKVDKLLMKFGGIDKAIEICEEEKRTLFKKTNGLNSKIIAIDKEFSVFKKVHAAILKLKGETNKAKTSTGMYVIAIVMVLLNIITLTLLGIRTFNP